MSFPARLARHTKLWIIETWLIQRGMLFCWSPVCLGLGVGVFFSLRSDPAAMHFWALGGVGLLIVALMRVVPGEWRPVGWALILMAIGFGLAGARSAIVAEPVLGWRYYGPVEGRLVAVDRSSSDALRLTLDQVVLKRTSSARTPARVRVALHGAAPRIPLEPGTRLILTAHLAPPGGPVEPGGFDFQRHAWFQRLGAVGYSRTPVLRLGPAQEGQWLNRMRLSVSARIRTHLDAEVGGFAAAIMTGDRSGIGQETLSALRISNLAHLLAISGLHMGLLTGFVFAALRLGLIAIPGLGLRLPVKKIAAVGALVAGGAYLALSGGSVSTERAYIMVTVMLAAVLADRRVLSLRAVALAALIVLTLRPEALLGPGFQMSFAATTALVAVFTALRDHREHRAHDTHSYQHRSGYRAVLYRTWRSVSALVLSSAVAGLATAPIAAAHFNQIAHYGLIANLASVPLMGVLVIPMAVLAGLLMPLGLEHLALWIMGLGLEWILGVAHWASSLEGARGMVPSPDPLVLPLIALGALFVTLWQGRLRGAGVLPIIAAFTLWAATPRPDVLIAESGGLVGIMTPHGRALSVARGSGFVARNWLENDGNPAEQDEGHMLWQETLAESEWPILPLRGKRAAEAFTECQTAQIVVLNVTPPEREWPCKVLTPKTLRASGALALYRDGSGIRIQSTRDITGTRLWHPTPE